MKPILEFNIKTVLPKNLNKLEDLAWNYWWSWNSDAKDLFHEIDRDLFIENNHNPIQLLNKLSSSRINELDNDKSFLNKLNKIHSEFEKYINQEKWFNTTDGDKEYKICYFSPEYGINESFPNYSGGLGVLSGDHLKSASDLGLPLIAIGLLYQEGYFRQRLANNGWQNESYNNNDFYTMPLELQKDKDGNELLIHIKFPDDIVYARIWKLKVGVVELYLLDTNITKNTNPTYRDITNRLYGGDRETRIQQEIILGIGGVRALTAMNIEPAVFHINEGHAAFALLERTKNFMNKFNLNFHQAYLITKNSSVFTTHTPVPAGNETFVKERILRYFEEYVHELQISFDDLYKLGTIDNTESEKFYMTTLGLNLTSFANGVSKLHSYVSRDMWKDLWQNLHVDEVPIEGLTNGIHNLTWLSKELKEVLDRYLGKDWVNKIDDENVWNKVDSIPDKEIWDVKNIRRHRLIDYTRDHLIKSETGYLSNHQLRNLDNFLNDDTLTIGFARRFATYKRSSLLFSDMERLKKLVLNSEKPIQILIAGKAHPHDVAGKETIMEIIQKIKQHNLENNIVFLEDYDMVVGRLLVKGCDVWLNNPIRPLEASGTSGMKAAINGSLNLSILDGWWDEGFNKENGFSIGNGEEFIDKEEQRLVESQELYDMLEYEVIPQFYNRDKNNIPLDWMKKVKAAIKTISPYFSTERMVKEYATNYYLPAYFRYLEMILNNGENSKILRDWLTKIENNWNDINIFDTSINNTNLKNNDNLYLKAKVYLANLSIEDIKLQAYFGKKGVNGQILNGKAIDMNLVDVESNIASFETLILAQDSGMYGLTFRIIPNNKLINKFQETRFIKWA